MTVARLCLVSGRVQGVFYRVSARSQARGVNVRGYARNLPDGRVEVHAEGDPADVDALCGWLWDGPPAAEVAAVECEAVAPVGYTDFTAE